MKTIKYLTALLFCLFLLVSGCNDGNTYFDHESRLKTIEKHESLVVNIPEMIRFSDIETLDIELELLGPANEVFTYSEVLTRQDETIFSSQILALKTGSYKLINVSLKTDNSQIQYQFDDIAFSLVGELEDGNAEFTIGNTEKILSLNLYSVSYESSIGPTYDKTASSEESNPYFFLFVNRCNPLGDVEKYHEVLLYDITFEKGMMDKLLNIPSTFDIPSFTYNNYKSDNGRELLCVGPFPWSLNLMEEGEHLNVVITPQDSSLKIYTELDSNEWNNHLLGKTDFIHLQIGCEKP